MNGRMLIAESRHLERHLLVAKEIERAIRGGGRAQRCGLNHSMSRFIFVPQESASPRNVEAWSVFEVRQARTIRSLLRILNDVRRKQGQNPGVPLFRSALVCSLGCSSLNRPTARPSET